jgi:hypothetical protein
MADEQTFDERSGSGLMFDPASYESPPQDQQASLDPRLLNPAAMSGGAQQALETPGSADPMKMLMSQMQQSMAGTDKLDEERRKTLDPMIAGVRRDLDRPGPQVPQLEKTPKPPAQQLGQGSMEFLQIATVFGALAGVLTRRGTTTALNAFSGAIQGFTQGNLEVYKSKIEEWREAVATVKDDNQSKLDQYNAIWKDRKLNIDQKMESIKLVASQYGDEITYNLGQQRNFTMLAQSIEKQREFFMRFEESTKRLDNQTRSIDARLDNMQAASDAALMPLVERRLNGDKSVTTQMGRSQATLKAFNTLLSKVQQERGFTAENQAAADRDYASKLREATTVGGRAGNIAISVNEAKNMVPQALAASRASPRRGIALWNEAANEWKIQKGDPAFANLVVKTNSLINIYSRAATGSSQGTVDSRVHAREMLNPNQPDKAYEASLQGLIDEISVMQKAPGNVREEMRTGVQEPPAQVTAPSAGWKVIE